MDLSKKSAWYGQKSYIRIDSLGDCKWMEGKVIQIVSEGWEFLAQWK